MFICFLLNVKVNYRYFAVIIIAILLLLMMLKWHF